MLELAAELIRTDRRWFLSADHVLEGLPKENRSTVLLFIRCALRDGAAAIVSIDTDFHWNRYEYGDPRTWHLPMNELSAEANRAGLDVEVLSQGKRASEHGRRTTATVALRRREE